MSLPKRFDSKVKRGLGLHAVWPPGDPIEIGDVMTRQNGIFHPIDNVSNFGVTPDLQEFPDQRSLSFEAAGTVTTTIQGGVQVDPTDLDANASAKVEIEFKRNDSYFIRTSELTGVEIENVRTTLRALRTHPEWRHGKFFIVWQLYNAANFSFLGTEKKNKKISFGGKGKAILKFLTMGATAGLTRTSTGSVTVDLTGKRGPIVMALLRIKKNGELIFA